MGKSSSPLGNLILGHMKARGLSLGQVARSSGIPKSTIRSITSGKTTYKKAIEHLFALAGTLEVSVEEMCGAILGADDEQPERSES